MHLYDFFYIVLNQEKLYTRCNEIWKYLKILFDKFFLKDFFYECSLSLKENLIVDIVNQNISIGIVLFWIIKREQMLKGYSYYKKILKKVFFLP